MGKTAAGAVWLNEEQLSPYDYWQFWRNTEDGDVARFLKLFTDAAAGRDRQAGGAAGRRDQRGQEGAGDRGDRADARPREGGGRRRDGAQDVRAGRDWRGTADRRESRRRELERGLGVLAAFVQAPASSSPTARRGGRSRAAGCASTISRFLKANDCSEKKTWMTRDRHIQGAPADEDVLLSRHRGAVDLGKRAGRVREGRACEVERLGKKRHVRSKVV